MPPKKQVQLQVRRYGVLVMCELTVWIVLDRSRNARWVEWLHF